MNIYRLNIIVCLMFVLACNVKKQTNSDTNTKEVTANVPEVIFVNYSINKFIEPKVELLNYKVVEGKLKGTSSIFSNDTVSYSFSQLDKELNIIESQKINNPLIKTIEYADETGLLAKKTILLDSAQFSIRTQLNEKTNFIRVEKTDENSKKQTILLTSKLN